MKNFRIIVLILSTIFFTSCYTTKVSQTPKTQKIESNSVSNHCSTYVKLDSLLAGREVGLGKIKTPYFLPSYVDSCYCGVGYGGDSNELLRVSCNDGKKQYGYFLSKNCYTDQTLLADKELILLIDKKEYYFSPFLWAIEQLKEE